MEAIVAQGPSGTGRSPLNTKAWPKRPWTNFRSYYLRIADDYMERVDREARALLSEGSAALPGAADEPRLP